MPLIAAGAVTGIGSLPLTSITSAIRSVAEFSPEVPFWPQLPQLSERESIVGQGLAIVEDLIEPRNEGYGYQVKEGQLDSVLEILHRSSGELTPLNAAGFGPFERMCRVKPDIISFDAHDGLDLFFADWHALDFVNQGGAVAYGIVPTRPGLNAVDAATIFIRWLKGASLAGDPQKFAQRAMITATCGLGLLDTSAIAEPFSVAHS